MKWGFYSLVRFICDVHGSEMNQNPFGKKANIFKTILHTTIHSLPSEQQQGISKQIFRLSSFSSGLKKMRNSICQRMRALCDKTGSEVYKEQCFRR